MQGGRTFGRQGVTEDVARLLFHRVAVASGPQTKLRFGLVVELPNQYATHISMLSLLNQPGASPSAQACHLTVQGMNLECDLRPLHFHLRPAEEPAVFVLAAQPQMPSGARDRKVRNALQFRVDQLVNVTRNYAA